MGIGHSKRTKDPKYRGVGSEDARLREQERHQLMAGASLGKEVAFSRRFKKSKKVIKGLDKSMIGSPMNFKHVGHIGVSDLKANQINGSAFILYRADAEPTTIPHQHETTMNAIPAEQPPSCMGTTRPPILLEDSQEAINNPPGKLSDPSSPLGSEPQKELPPLLVPEIHVFRLALIENIEDFLFGEEGILPSQNIIRSDD